MKHIRLVYEKPDYKTVKVLLKLGNKEVNIRPLWIELIFMFSYVITFLLGMWVAYSMVFSTKVVIGG